MLTCNIGKMELFVIIVIMTIFYHWINIFRYKSLTWRIVSSYFRQLAEVALSFDVADSKSVGMHPEQVTI